VSINGTGIVFYLNKYGGLSGIMLWGVPVSSSNNSSKAAAVEVLDDNLAAIVDRAKAALLQSVEDNQIFLYNMNSR